MERGAIIEAARRQGADLLKGGLVLLAICLAVLGLNWKYCYNAVAGPVPFTPALSASPGARDFVRVEGRFLPTGMSEQLGVGLRGNPAKLTIKHASYLMTVIDKRVLIVKVSPDFSGRVVEGALRPLPEEIRGVFHDPASVHPWLIEATVGYRADANLFVMIALPVAALVLIALPAMSWRALRPDRHPALARLRSLGNPVEVAEAIENEVISAGSSARRGPFWFTRSWIVCLEPALLLVPIGDLAGIGDHREAAKGRAGELRHTLRLWTRGRGLYDSVKVVAAEAEAVMAWVRASLPWAVVDDPRAFDRRWRDDRAACERLADSRRSPARVG
jgi:hypothetical protein